MTNSVNDRVRVSVRVIIIHIILPCRPVEGEDMINRKRGMGDLFLESDECPMRPYVIALLKLNIFSRVITGRVSGIQVESQILIQPGAEASRF